MADELPSLNFMENAAQHLSREHKVILKSLERLDRALQPMDMAVIQESLAFLRDRLRFHLAKEEQVVYPLLSRRIKTSKTVLKKMEEEHRLEFSCIEEALNFARLAGHNATFAPALVACCRSVTDFLRDHIRNEEEHFLPLLGRHFSRQEDEALVTEMQLMESVEEKGQEAAR